MKNTPIELKNKKILAASTGSKFWPIEEKTRRSICKFIITRNEKEKFTFCTLLIGFVS